MKCARIKRYPKKISSESGFSLLEILASSFVILVVAGVTSQLLMNPKREMAAIKQKSEVIDYLDNEFRLLNDSSDPLPTASYRKCSSCNATLDSCSSICGGTAHGVECPSLPPCSIPSPLGSSCIDPNLSAIIQNRRVCYVSVFFDPTTDDTSGLDPVKATQMSALARIRRPDESAPDEHALTAFIFRR